MTYQPFLVAQLTDGFVTETEPWLLPDKAYPTMTNVFNYHGVINKKGGNILMGRLGIREEDLVDVAGVINTTLTWFPVEPGSLIITDGTTTFTDDGVGGFTITGGAGTVNAPTNYTTGAINITFTAIAGTASARYFMLVDDYSPCMGLRTLQLEDSIDINLIGFDRRKAYQYRNGTERFANITQYKNSGYNFDWTGEDYDFFWTQNYLDAFWATNNVPGGHFYAVTNISAAASAVITIGVHNFVNGDRVYIANATGMTQINNKIGTITAIGATTITVNINTAVGPVYSAGGVVWSIEKTKTASGDGIRWYDDGNGWVNFAPPTDNSATPNILQGCLMIVTYKGRVLAFNTVEGTTYAGRKRHAQRVRYSKVGIPFVAQSFPSLSGITSSDGDGWYQSPGLGGFLDAPTGEEIVSAGFVKDTLVVYFEQSTWRLDYTGNPVLPFVWNRLNSEFGSESTFSTVLFDKSANTVGSFAITACNSAEVVRIDQNINDQVFKFHNEEEGHKRVYGIRDYYNRMILWSYSDSAEDKKFPNRTLVFNYDHLSWTKFKNYYTCFGYYRRVNDLTWGESTEAWSTYDITWGSESLQSKFPYVVGGNTHGFVHQLQDIDEGDFVSSNDDFYVIQNVTGADPSVFTVPNHNFSNDDYVYISEVNGATGLNDKIYTVQNATDDTFTLQDLNLADVSEAGYTYGGIVSVVDNFELVTKKFNPFYGNGQKVRVGYVDLFLDNTTSGEIIVEIYTDENDVSPVDTKTIPLTDPKSAVTNKFWYRVYTNVSAQSISLKFKYSEVANGQIYDIEKVEQEVRLHGWILWATPAGRLV